MDNEHLLMFLQSSIDILEDVQDHFHYEDDYVNNDLIQDAILSIKKVLFNVKGIDALYILDDLPF